MSPRNQFQTICVVKTCANILSSQGVTAPKVQPAPLWLTLYPHLWSGSDHKRSQIGPSWGTSCTRSSFRIWSKVSMWGERPPCVPKMAFSTTAVSGRQSNRSVNIFQVLVFSYFLIHSSQKPYCWVIVLDSWLPLRMVSLSLYLTFKAKRRHRVSTLQYPLSTQSPRKRQLVSGMFPPILKSSIRSQNCPCMSPQMMTGALTGATLDSADMISLALSQMTLTSASGSSSHLLSLEMYSSMFPTSKWDNLLIQIMRQCFQYIQQCATSAQEVS